MRRLLAAGTLLVLATGCNTFGSGAAASVDGVNVTWDQLKSLASAQPISGSSDAVADGVLKAEPSRQALPTLLQLAELTAELKRRGTPLTDTDRGAARQQLEQGQAAATFGSLDETGKSAVVDLVAAQTKVGDALKEMQASDPAVRGELFGRFPKLARVVCGEGLQVAPDAVDEVADELRSGADLATVASKFQNEAQPIGKGETCLDAVLLRSVGIKDPERLFVDAGSVVTEVFSSRGGTAALVLRSTGVATLSADDPRAEAVVSQVLQSGAQGWALYALATADVRIDSRLGSWDGAAIVPPATPLDRAPETTIAPQPVPEPSPETGA